MVMSNGAGTNIVPDSDVLKRYTPTESSDDNTSDEKKRETPIPIEDTDASYISNELGLSSVIRRTSDLRDSIGHARDKILELRVLHVAFYLVKSHSPYRVRVDKKWIKDVLSQAHASINDLEHCILDYKRIVSELTDELNKAEEFIPERDGNVKLD